MDDLIDIQNEIIEAEEAQAGIIRRNPKIYAQRINPPAEYDDTKFRQIYRISKQLARTIVDLVSNEISVSNRGGGICPSLQVLTTIRYLAKGAYEHDVGNLHGISQPSMSRIIRKLVQAIANHRADFIKFPEGPQQVERTKADFYELVHCPNVIEAIDGTHIKIKYPGGEHALEYINGKGFFSLNVQVVCDAQQRITDVE